MRVHAAKAPAEEQAAGPVTGPGPSAAPPRPVPADSITGWRSGPLLEPAVGVGAAGGPLDAATSSEIAAARRGGAPLDGDTRTAMEGRLGTDLSGVRVHADPTAADLCTRIQAKAFTVGPHVFFRDGHPDIARSEGRHLLAHELTHVAQQAGSPTPVVQRTFFDGEHDWIAASTHRAGYIGPVRARSQAMQAIDTAVRGVIAARARGFYPMLDAALDVLADRINDWHGPRPEPPGVNRMRATEVDRLEQEAHDLRTELADWRDTTRHDVAMATHRANLLQVRAWLVNGRDHGPDLRLRNSCDWILRGRVPFYVVTETADHDYRAEVLLGRRPTASASTYFPNPDADPTRQRTMLAGNPAGHAYNRQDAGDRTNVVQNRRQNGWNRPGRLIAVTDIGVGLGQDEVWKTVRHELHHEADKHRGTELDDPVANAVGAEKTFQENLRLYKTEYRAHVYMRDNRFLHPAVPGPVNELGYTWSGTQWAVLSFLRQDYPQIALAFGGAHPTAEQRRFRQAVHAYENPDVEGFNKWNSWRIDDLYTALDQIQGSTAFVGGVFVQNVLAAVDALTQDDARYIYNQREAVMLRQKIRHHLTGLALQAFNTHLAAVLPAPNVLPAWWAAL